MENSELINQHVVNINILNDIFSFKKKKFSINGELHLTKSKKQRGYVDVLVLDDYISILKEQYLVDKNLIKSLGKIKSIYEKDNPVLPKHLPVKCSNKQGVFKNNENVFIYFPYALGNKNANIENHFSFEFVEIASSMFEKVLLPCCKKLFSSTLQLEEIYKEDNVKVYTYIFSYFHEFFHQVGPWKATPVKNKNLKLHWKYHAIMGELSSDLLISRHIPKLRKENLINLLGKMFYYARKGFVQNPTCAYVNEDCDSWGGVFLLSELLKLIAAEDERLVFDVDNIYSKFDGISDEIQQLGNEIIGLSNADEQEKLLKSWMITKLPYDGEKYQIPNNVRSLFNDLMEIDENI